MTPINISSESLDELGRLHRRRIELEPTIASAPASEAACGRSLELRAVLGRINELFPPALDPLT